YLFFFQAEDGIRDFHVTGVQTCALPIYRDYRRHRDDAPALAHLQIGGVEPEIRPVAGERALEEGVHALVDVLAELGNGGFGNPRSEERRVGKECRYGETAVTDEKVRCSA